MDFIRPLRCKRLDWRSVFYSTQAAEVILICVGMLSNHWLEGWLVPVPWIRVQMAIGLVETCLTWQYYTACARDMEVLQLMAQALGKRLDYVQTHTFDIPRSFLYVVLGLHFCTVAVLFSEHPLALPRGLNMIQLIFLVICLCWFGLSSFKQDMCDYLEECTFGWSLYLVLVALVLSFSRLVYHFYRFRNDGEDCLDAPHHTMVDEEGMGSEAGVSPNPRQKKNQKNQSFLRQPHHDQDDPLAYALLPYHRKSKEIELVDRKRVCSPPHKGVPGDGQIGCADVL